MPVYRSIRIQMPDRPGALSAISAALAVQGVDIVRLDIVGHDRGLVVDDLLLSGGDQESIGQAIASFHHDVIVRTFEETSGDPTLAMGEGLMATVNARSREEALETMCDYAQRLARADRAVLASALTDGSMSVVDSRSAAMVMLGPDEPFAGRWVLHRQTAAAFALRAGWAPGSLVNALPGAWIAMAPVSPFDVLLLTRNLNIPFLGDELERIATFAEVAGAILGLRGQLAASGSMPAGREAELPAGALTLGAHQRAEGATVSSA